MKLRGLNLACHLCEAGEESMEYKNPGFNKPGKNKKCSRENGNGNFYFVTLLKPAIYSFY